MSDTALFLTKASGTLFVLTGALIFRMLDANYITFTLVAGIVSMLLTFIDAKQLSWLGLLQLIIGALVALSSLYLMVRVEEIFLYALGTGLASIALLMAGVENVCSFLEWAGKQRPLN